MNEKKEHSVLYHLAMSILIGFAVMFGLIVIITLAWKFLFEPAVKAERFDEPRFIETMVQEASGDDFIVTYADSETGVQYMVYKGEDYVAIEPVMGPDGTPAIVGMEEVNRDGE